MLIEKTSKMTMTMVFGGTFLLSILSFVTTLYGMLIIVPLPLAIIGSLGIQTAMLGIAWNLIRIQEERWKYAVVFSVAALFSIFFSYANFDINIKAHIRPHAARHAYYDSTQKLLAEYSSLAKKAVSAGRYQVDRLIDLIKLEEEKGWATISDEGSRDRFLQTIIDGARLTVESWRASQGSDYQQGKGRGLIVNYLESRLDQARQNYSAVSEYQRLVDDVIGQINGEMPVAEQYSLVNKAFIAFPLGEIQQVLMDSDLVLAAPVSVTAFAERPVNGQQALRMVMDDLLSPDPLTIFALVLAAAIDMIVLLMALAGGYAAHNADRLFDKLDRDIQARIEKASFDDPNAFSEVLKENVERYRSATNYSLDLIRLMAEYKSARENYRLVLKKRNEAIKSGKINKSDKVHLIDTANQIQNLVTGCVPDESNEEPWSDFMVMDMKTNKQYDKSIYSDCRSSKRFWHKFFGLFKKEPNRKNRPYVKGGSNRGFSTGLTSNYRDLRRTESGVKLSGSGKSFQEKLANSPKNTIEQK